MLEGVYEKLSIIKTPAILLAIQLELCTLECESHMQILVQNSTLILLKHQQGTKIRHNPLSFTQAL
jgi:hypothetical protein